MNAVRRLAIVALVPMLLPSTALGSEELPKWLVAPESETLTLGGGGDSHATESRKFLSVGLALGLKADMANLGETIAQDGTVDLAETTMASTFYSTDTLVVGDRDNYAIWYNSEETDSAFTLLGAEPTMGGPLLGADIGGSAMIELGEFIPVPLFARVGFHYVTRMSGGVQQRQLGNVLENLTGPGGPAPELAVPLVLAGMEPSDFDGGVLSTTFDAAWFEIPLSVGFTVPIKGNSMLYGWLGMSYFSGGFSVGLDLDEQYVNAVSTHIDLDEPDPAQMVQKMGPTGAVSEIVEFQTSSMGINYGLGGQLELGMGLVWYLELNASGAAKTVFSSDLSPEAAQLLTALSSSTLASLDDDWFKRLAFPVVMGGGSVRTGLRFYIF